MITNLDKAITAFFLSLLALLATAGVSTDWASPDLVTSAGVVIAAIVNGAIVWAVPNREKK